VQRSHWRVVPFAIQEKDLIFLASLTIALRVPMERLAQLG